MLITWRSEHEDFLRLLRVSRRLRVLHFRAENIFCIFSMRSCWVCQIEPFPWCSLTKENWRQQVKNLFCSFYAYKIIRHISGADVIIFSSTVTKQCWSKPFWFVKRSYVNLSALSRVGTIDNLWSLLLASRYGTAIYWTKYWCGSIFSLLPNRSCLQALTLKVVF